jgi:chromosome segregation ATPase
MWISRNEYENLKANIKCLENRYSTQRNINEELLYDLDMCHTKINKLEDQKAELEEYKQKYADEVQKRLELIELYER